LWSRRSEYGRRLSLARGLVSRGAIVLVIVVVEEVDARECGWAVFGVMGCDG
jgi:hypothetical protein